MKIETRNFNTDFTVEDNVVEGYALRFNSPSKDLGGFVEVIQPEALKGLDLSDVRALLNHSWEQVLGYTKSGTLLLEIDEIGLRYMVEMPNTSFANDLRESLKRGDISGSSFAFSVAENGDTWKLDKESGMYLRTIHKIESISEVSVVSNPAYESANAGLALRSLEQHKADELRKLEQEQIRIELELL